VGVGALSADRLPGDLLLLGAEEERRSQEPRRGRPELLETYEKLGIPIEEQKMLAGVAVDAVFDSVSVATTFREKLAEAGVIFCSISEAVQDHPELVQEVSRLRRAATDNFYAALNSAAVFTDGSFVYIPKGVRCPMELSHLLPHQRAEHRPVRAHADRRRRGQLRQLPGGLHGAAARREPAARRGGRTGRDGRREIKYSTVQNWYPGDENGKGGIYNFVTKRGDCRGERQDLLDPGRDRLGHHLEVPELHPARRHSVGEFYSVAVTKGMQQADTGTKMIHLGKNTTLTIVSKGISAGRARTSYRGLVRIAARPTTRATTPSATRC
jgi:Fe-S cluster assembly protein SufB